MKKYIFHLLLSLTFLLYCGNLDRDNVLDPKNPNSKANRVVLVELFVVENTGYEYCNTALDGLEELCESDNYRGKVLLLEYHLKKDNLNDSFALPQCYDRYVEYEPVQSDRGIPDAFFNGKIERVQGASLDKAGARYDDVLTGLTGKKSYFRFEVNKQVEGNSIDLDVKVIRLGRNKKQDLNLFVVLYEDIETDLHHYVVKKIFQPQTINSIEPGEVKSFYFSDHLISIQKMENIHAVVFIQDQNETTMEVYQAAKF
ncbi:hypothetical protein H8E88_26750 [candidate division KSB1 bacterium]|nr:hypothetical protein [candidate division KSB1 bacterium]MBL7094200.1 hypothetical protein [candidate division KSB1 bacterium]